MEDLRSSLVAPCVTTTLMIFGLLHSMQEYVKIKYKAIDDNGKSLLPHPYEPWIKDTTLDKKYLPLVDKAYRAFRMFENVKEWTFLSIPIMFIFHIYGSNLPYISDEKRMFNIMDYVTIGSGMFYLYATNLFIKGYIESANLRLKGFKLRRRLCEFWLFGTIISLLWFVIEKYYILA